MLIFDIFILVFLRLLILVKEDLDYHLRLCFAFSNYPQKKRLYRQYLKNSQVNDQAHQQPIDPKGLLDKHVAGLNLSLGQLLLLVVI